MQERNEGAQKTSGVHVWLVLMKAFASVSEWAEQELKKSCLGSSDFRVLEVLQQKGALPVNTIGPKVHLTTGSISVAIDRLEARQLVKRKDDAEDRRVRLVELTAKGRSLIAKAFEQHAAVMEEAAGGLTSGERAKLVMLLKKLGKSADERKTQGHEQKPAGRQSSW